MADIVERIIIDDSQAINPLKNIQDNTEKITKRMQDLDEWTKKTIADMSKEVQNTSKVTQETAQKTIKANNSIKESFMDQVKGFKLFGVSIDDVKGKLEDYKTKLTNVGKSISSLISGLTKGAGATKLFSGAFKIMSGAIAATGIGALILLLGSLIAFFTKTQAGMDKLSKVTSYLSAGMSVLFERFASIGKALTDLDEPFKKLGSFIIDNLFNRIKAVPLFLEGLAILVQGLTDMNWTVLKVGATQAGLAIAQLTTGLDNKDMENAGKWISDTGDAFDKAGNRGAYLDGVLKKLNRDKTEFILTEAKMSAEMKKQNEIARDTTKSLSDRIKAAKEVSRIEESLASQKLALAQRNYNLIKEQNSITKETNDADRKAEVDALKEVYAIKGELSDKLRKSTRLENQLIKEAIGDFEKMGAEIMDVARAKNLISKEQDFNIVKAEQLKLLTDYVAKLKEIGTVLKIDVSKEVDLATQLIEGLQSRVFERETDLIPTIKLKEIKFQPTKVTVNPPTSGKKKFDWDAWWDELEGFDDLWSTFLQKTLDIDGPEAEQLTKGLQAFVSEWGSLLDQSTQIHLDQLDKQLDGVTERKDKLEGLLDEERDNYERGLANNYLSTKQTYDNLIAEEERLNNEKEKLQAKAAKRQLIAETAQQTASLITSSINIIKGFSHIPIVGLPLGIAAVASLLAFFVKTKADAFKATKLYTGAERINDYFGFGKRDGESDLPGSSGKGYRLVSERTGKRTNTIISGREMLIPERVSLQNEGFFQNLRTGMYNGIDLSEAIGFYKTFKVPKGNVIQQNNVMMQNSKAKTSPVAHLIPIGNGKYLVYELGKDQGHGSIIEIKK